MNDYIFEIVMIVAGVFIPALIAQGVAAFVRLTNAKISKEKSDELEAAVWRAAQYAVRRAAGKPTAGIVSEAVSYLERGKPELIKSLDKNVARRTEVLVDRLSTAIDAVTKQARD